MKKRLKRIILSSALIGLLASTSAEATPVLLDFEDIPDLTSVGDYYSSYGVHFNNAISQVQSHFVANGNSCYFAVDF